MKVFLERSFNGLYKFFKNPYERKFVFYSIFYGSKKRYEEKKINFLNYKIRVPDALSFIWQFKEIFVDESYKFESELTEPVIYDCGSNIGMSCIYFKRIFPGAKIKAFEADPNISKYLKENLNANGLYNAGYITFKNDKLGNEALRWWEKRCIEWCFRKKADGKFGDQMYLNELSKFEGVQTLNHKGILANWNVQQYTFINTNNSIEGVISLSNRFKVIFYHFHYLKFYNNGKVELGRKYLPIKVVELFYKPYIRCLYELAPNDSHGATKFPLNWKTPILFVKRKIEKTYNIISVADIIEE